MEAERHNDRSGVLIMLACTAGYALLEYLIADPTTMTEGDLYRMLFGLLDGEATGLGLLDIMHYGTSFSFGYLAFFYHVAGESALHHPFELIALMNHVGYACAVVTAPLLWLCVKAAYDAATASAAMLLFILSPVFIDLGSAGHPILPAYMFLAAGGALIFLERGWATLAGFALLLAGMTMRADIALAMPWIALTHRHAGGWKDYARKVAFRSVLLGLVFLAFLLIRHIVIGGAPVDASATSHGQSFASYMGEFFRRDNIIGGAASGIFGCGPATVLAVILAGALLLRRERLTPQSASLYAGPLVIMAVAVVFWVPIGINARHFITFTLGASLFIALVITREITSPMRALSLVLLIAAANQFASEAARPLLLRSYHASYIGIPDAERTLTMSPIGFTWKHVTTLQQRHRIYGDWIENTLGSVCDAKTVVMMDYDDAEQAMSELYEGEPEPSAHLVDKGDFKRIVSVTKGAHTLIIVSKADAWPADPLAVILARPDLADAKILVDPYAASTYDHVQVPPERAARLGCGTLRRGMR